jgi:DNA-directed RNA polymerase subunit alpha
MLNLKQVRFKQQIDGTDKETLIVKVGGKETLTAGDIGKFTSAFQVLNIDHVICNMESSVTLELELTINKGRGYVPSEENKIEDASLGVISIDSIHTPVKNVKYGIENFRVGQKTDYEKLVFDIVTDGSIHQNPLQQLSLQFLKLFSHRKIT